MWVWGGLTRGPCPHGLTILPQPALPLFLLLYSDGWSVGRLAEAVTTLTDQYIAVLGRVVFGWGRHNRLYEGGRHCCCNTNSHLKQKIQLPRLHEGLFFTIHTSSHMSRMIITSIAFIAKVVKVLTKSVVASSQVQTLMLLRLVRLVMGQRGILGWLLVKGKLCRSCARRQ